MHLQETLSRIREVGLENARVMPAGSKRSKVQIKTAAGWETLIETNNQIAEDILVQAKTKVIFG
jgi:hypothetical protein